MMTREESAKYAGVEARATNWIALSPRISSGAPRNDGYRSCIRGNDTVGGGGVR